MVWEGHRHVVLLDPWALGFGCFGGGNIEVKKLAFFAIRNLKRWNMC